MSRGSEWDSGRSAGARRKGAERQQIGEDRAERAAWGVRNGMGSQERKGAGQDSSTECSFHLECSDMSQEHEHDEFTHELLKELGPEVGRKLAGQNLVSEAQAQEALASLGPVVLGSLKRQKDEGTDNDSLEALIAQAGGEEEAVEDLDQVFARQSGVPDHDITPLLGSEQQEQTAAALSQKMGIGKGIAKQLLPMLVPIILGKLMKKGRQDTGTKTRSGGIGAILDRNGNGSVLDDIAGIVLSGKGGGGLGSLIGGFLKK